MHGHTAIVLLVLVIAGLMLGVAVIGVWRSLREARRFERESIAAHLRHRFY